MKQYLKIFIILFILNLCFWDLGSKNVITEFFSAMLAKPSLIVNNAPSNVPTGKYIDCGIKNDDEIIAQIRKTNSPLIDRYTDDFGNKRCLVYELKDDGVLVKKILAVTDIDPLKKTVDLSEIKENYVFIDSKTGIGSFEPPQEIKSNQNKKQSACVDKSYLSSNVNENIQDFKYSECEYLDLDSQSKVKSMLQTCLVSFSDSEIAEMINEYKEVKKSELAFTGEPSTHSELKSSHVNVQDEITNSIFISDSDSKILNDNNLFSFDYIPSTMDELKAFDEQCHKVKLENSPILWGSDAGSVRQVNDNYAVYPVFKSQGGSVYGDVHVKTAPSRQRIYDVTPRRLPVLPGYSSYKFKKMKSSDFSNYYNIGGSKTIFDEPGDVGWYGNVLRQFNMWQYKGFLDYIKSFGQEYESLILAMDEKQKTSKSFARELDEVPGFKVKYKHFYAFGLIKSSDDEHEFREFIANEAKRIQQKYNKELEVKREKIKQELVDEECRKKNYREDWFNRKIKLDEQCNDKDDLALKEYEQDIQDLEGLLDASKNKDRSLQYSSIHFLKKAKKSFSDKNFKGFERNLSRAKSIFFDLSDHNDSRNSIKLNLDTEIKELSNGANDLKKAFEGFSCIENIGQVVSKMSDMIQKESNNFNYKEKYKLIDLGLNLLDVGETLASIIKKQHDDQVEVSKEMQNELFLKYEKAVEAISEVLLEKHFDVNDYDSVLDLDNKSSKEEILNSIDLVASTIFPNNECDLKQVVSFEIDEGDKISNVSDVGKQMLSPMKEIFTKASEVSKEIASSNYAKNEYAKELKARNDWHVKEQKALNEQNNSAKEISESKNIKNKVKNFLLRKDSKDSLAIGGCIYDLDEIKENLDSYNDKTKQLAFLEHTYTDAALKNITQEEFALLEHNKNRKDAIHQTLLNSNHVIEKSYELGDNSSLFLEANDIEADKFKKIKGNAAQQQLHNDLVDTINDTSDLLLAYNDNFHINNISSMVYHSANIAYESNMYEDYYDAYTFCDIASCLLDMGKQFTRVANVFDVSNQALIKMGKIITRGVIKGGQKTVGHIVDFKNKIIDNPLGALFDVTVFVVSVYNPVAVLAVGAGMGLGYLAGELTFNRQEFLQNIGDWWDENLRNKAWDEIAEDSIAEAFDFAVMGVCYGKAAVKLKAATKMGKKLASIVKNEMRVAEAIAGKDKNTKKLLSPITSILNDSKKTLQIANDIGIEPFKDAVELAKDSPNVLKTQYPLSKVLKRISKIEASENAKSFRSYLQQIASTGKRHSFLGKSSGFQITSQMIAAENETGLSILYRIMKGEDFIAKNSNPEIIKDALDHIVIGNFETAINIGGDIRKGLKSGLHTVEGFENFRKLCNFDLDLFTIEELPNKVSRVFFKDDSIFLKKNYFKRACTFLPGGEKLEGVKTLFPKEYCKEKIHKMCLDIISDYSNYDVGGRFIGRTSCGINIAVQLNEQGRIATAYPTWFQ